MHNMLTGIAASIILNKVGGAGRTQMSMPKTPTPQKVSLSPYMRRTGRRGHGFRKGLSKAASVEGSSMSASSRYNLTLKKLLNLSSK
tara:strand:- start:511 stop:771 length:261 start_codon:yes stop_codon:yes gene_type:complete